MLPFNKIQLEKDPFPILYPNVHINFYERLKQAEAEYLMPSLLEHISTLDITVLDKELSNYAGMDKLRYLAKYGLRGELVFPVPYVLRGKPRLFGYYRSFLGFSQKALGGRPFGKFLIMEKQGRLSRNASKELPKLCISFIESAWILVKSIPDLSKDILHALSLLTLGAQLRGSRNTALGKRATKNMFQLVNEIVAPYRLSSLDNTITLSNKKNEKFMIDFSSDPDISIRKILHDGKIDNIAAIEIKGGTDYSNVHNRIGEAEKSHRKALSKGFNNFMTIVNVDKLDFEKAKLESPTTEHFFLLHNIIDKENPEHNRFKLILFSLLDIQ